MSALPDIQPGQCSTLLFNQLKHYHYYEGLGPSEWSCPPISFCPHSFVLFSTPSPVPHSVLSLTSQERKFDHFMSCPLQCLVLYNDGLVPSCSHSVLCFPFCLHPCNVCPWSPGSYCLPIQCFTCMHLSKEDILNSNYYTNYYRRSDEVSG